MASKTDVNWQEVSCDYCDTDQEAHVCIREIGQLVTRASRIIADNADYWASGLNVVLAAAVEIDAALDQAGLPCAVAGYILGEWDAPTLGGNVSPLAVVSSTRHGNQSVAIHVFLQLDMAAGSAEPDRGMHNLHALHMQLLNPTDMFKPPITEATRASELALQTLLGYTGPRTDWLVKHGYSKRDGIPVVHVINTAMAEAIKRLDRGTFDALAWLKNA